MNQKENKLVKCSICDKKIYIEQYNPFEYAKCDKCKESIRLSKRKHAIECFFQAIKITIKYYMSLSCWGTSVNFEKSEMFGATKTMIDFIQDRFKFIVEQDYYDKDFINQVQIKLHDWNSIFGVSVWFYPRKKEIKIRLNGSNHWWDERQARDELGTSQGKWLLKD